MQKYIASPIIDEDKILLLYSIYEELQISREQLQNYVITTMLVHIALDTHDTVPKNTIISSKSLKSQQLSVLAGDYFSGLYYYFLAETDDIMLIRTLAEGIKDVNENKISLYRNDPEHVDKLFSCIEKIESAIISKISNRFQISKWGYLASNFLLLKRLIQEREQFLNKGCSLLFDSLKRILGKDQETYLLNVYDRYTDHVRSIIEKVLHSNPNMNELLATRIKELIFNSGSIMNKIVEEG
nr:heptaprenyl diphosphate synthase component 1 [Fredinandcohnia sp. SECRCQ15]